jgi:hypothetical protein
MEKFQVSLAEELSVRMQTDSATMLSAKANLAILVGFMMLSLTDK